VTGGAIGRLAGMAEQDRLVTASEMDAMTPQQRADAVDAGVVHDWADVDADFRKRVEDRARKLASDLHADA
jgi:hypothetical protein